MFLPSKLTEKEIGLVIHGPEVIDSGEAKKVIEKLSCMGKVKAKLGGTMGKAAVLDAGLENEIDISQYLKPSVWIESLFKASDLVFLLNRGKTVETGREFGKIVASRLKRPEMKPLIQIESPESASGKLIPLNKKAGEWIEKLSEFFGIPAEDLQPFNTSVYLEKCSETGETRVVRKISGVFPGENILVNGIVIGKARSSSISVVSENGIVVAINGGEIKEHGLEKLHNYEKRTPIDLSKAWVKSGNLRRSNFFASQARKQSICSRNLNSLSMSRKGRVVLIDHAAEFAFEMAAGADLAVTVGDDTTAIAGELLFRLGIPVLGITDGDCDMLTSRTEMFPGSIVLRLVAGKDDIVGKTLKDELFRGENSIFLVDIHSFKRDVMKIADTVIEAIIEY